MESRKAVAKMLHDYILHQKDKLAETESQLEVRIENKSFIWWQTCEVKYISFTTWLLVIMMLFTLNFNTCEMLIINILRIIKVRLD